MKICLSGTVKGKDSSLGVGFVGLGSDLEVFALYALSDLLEGIPEVFLAGGCSRGGISYAWCGCLRPTAIRARSDHAPTAWGCGGPRAGTSSIAN